MVRNIITVNVYEDTGQEVPEAIMNDIEKGLGNYWQKTDPSFLAKFIGSGDSVQNKILVWLLENRIADNRIIFTIASLAKTLRVNRQTVTKLIKQLIENKLLVKIENKVYMLNPQVIQSGRKNKNVLNENTWNFYMMQTKFEGEKENES